MAAAIESTKRFSDMEAIPCCLVHADITIDSIEIAARLTLRISATRID
jgi:hypothetical protein